MNSALKGIELCSWGFEGDYPEFLTVSNIKQKPIN